MWNQNVTRAAAYAAALSAIAFAPFTAQAQSAAASPDDVAALREQIRLLDQKLRTLERNLELKDETAAAEAQSNREARRQGRPKLPENVVDLKI
jgi:phosphate-selective porin OprO/OprP